MKKLPQWIKNVLKQLGFGKEPKGEDYWAWKGR